MSVESHPFSWTVCEWYTVHHLVHENGSLSTDSEYLITRQLNVHLLTSHPGSTCQNDFLKTSSNLGSEVFCDFAGYIFKSISLLLFIYFAVTQPLQDGGGCHRSSVCGHLTDARGNEGWFPPSKLPHRVQSHYRPCQIQLVTQSLELNKEGRGERWRQEERRGEEGEGEWWHKVDKLVGK